MPNPFTRQGTLPIRQGTFVLTMFVATDKFAQRAGEENSKGRLP
jgi:hypothetical protein